MVLAMIARAGFVAFGPNRAWAQVIGNMVVEFIVLVSLIAFRPHKDRKGDWLAPFLSLIRLIAFGLLIAFIPSMAIDAIIRTVIGIVEIAVFGIPTVLLFFGLIWNAGYGYWWRRHTHRIEDGLEVERFVASDNDSQSRAAMTQVDANNFVSAQGPLNSRNDSGPSIGRRTSVMEPVDTAYGNGLDNGRHWQDSPHSAVDQRNSAYMYQNAAMGRHTGGGEDMTSAPNGNEYYESNNNRNSAPMNGNEYYDTNNRNSVPPAGTEYYDKNNRASVPPSRRSSRTSMYYTPQETGYHTPSEGQDQYFRRY